MASETAEEVAALLGLLDDSYIDLAPLLVKYHAMEEGARAPPDLEDVCRRLDQYVSLTDTPTNHQTGLFHEEMQTAFVSVCFPRLARAILLLPAHLTAISVWSDLLFKIDSDTPLLSAYIRTSEEAPALVFRLVESLASNPPSETSFRAANDFAVRWSRLFNLVECFLFDLFLTGLPSAPFPWTSSSSPPDGIQEATLADCFNSTALLIQRIVENPRNTPNHLLRTLKTDEMRLSLLMVLLGGPEFQTLPELQPVVSVLDAIRTHRPWLRCEGGRGEASKSCEELPSGSEMMACSGCLTVRYCSRGHQREEWKRHKPSCVKHSWD